MAETFMSILNILCVFGVCASVNTNINICPGVITAVSVCLRRPHRITMLLFISTAMWWGTKLYVWRWHDTSPCDSLPISKTSKVFKHYATGSLLVHVGRMKTEKGTILPGGENLHQIYYSLCVSVWANVHAHLYIYMCVCCRYIDLLLNDCIS